MRLGLLAMRRVLLEAEGLVEGVGDEREAGPA
jgi:hypothetical protein